MVLSAEVDTGTTSAWRELASHRAFWQWELAAQSARLVPLMIAFGFVLAGKAAAGSEAVGGLMVTCAIVASVVIAPFNGRLLDRIGPARGLPWFLGVAAALLALLAAAVAWKAPVALLLLLTVLVGLSAGGLSGAYRGMLTGTVGQTLVPKALAIDSLLVEAAVVTAPLLVAIAAIPGAAGAIVLMSLIYVAAAVLAVRLPDRPMASSERGPESSPTGNAGSLLRNRGFLFWVLVSVAFGHSLGTVETGALPLAIDLGGDAFNAALLIAVLSVMSILGGIGYATVAERLRWSPYLMSFGLLLAMAVAAVLLGVSGGWIGAAVAIMVIGICTSPLNIIRQHAAEHEVPAWRMSESFAILFAANGIGFALGGLLLALVPLELMLMLGGASAAGVWMIGPWLLRGRVNAHS